MKSELDTSGNKAIPTPDFNSRVSGVNTTPTVPCNNPSQPSFNPDSNVITTSGDKGK